MQTTSRHILLWHALASMSTNRPPWPGRPPEALPLYSIESSPINTIGVVFESLAPQAPLGRTKQHQPPKRKGYQKENAKMLEPAHKP